MAFNFGSSAAGGSGMAAGSSPQQQYQQALAQNANARALIMHGNPAAGIPRAVDSIQQIFSQNYTGTSLLGAVIQVPIKPVGLVKRFYIEVTAKIDAGATSTQTRGPFGPGAFFSQVSLTDLSQFQRHLVPGWGLNIISTAKRRRVYGAATTTDTPFGYGSNYGINTLASTIAATGNTTMDAFFEVPVSVDDVDFRGALDAGVTNANAFLTLTVNPNMFVTSTGDGTFSLFKSAGADLATIDSAVGFTVTVWQNYLDQLPRINNHLILPLLDLSHAYMVTGAATGLPVAAQDNPINIQNLRELLSMSVVYDNAGTLNPGTDINYFSLQSANAYYQWKQTPKLVAHRTRTLLGDDMPSGSYYFDFRHAPVETDQYGNTQLVVNPSSVGGSSAYLAYVQEQIAQIGAVMQAGSIQVGM